MSYMLDTNMISYLVNDRCESLFDHVVEAGSENLFISALVVAEIEYGVQKKGRPKNLCRKVEELLKRVTIVPFTHSDAMDFGVTRCMFEGSGLALAPFDMLIASHARGRGMTLVTNDQAFFKQTEIVNVIDWTRAVCK